ncbi:hypothetical protein RQP46_005499 [Phenoliferia psychrophenolica]
MERRAQYDDALATALATTGPSPSAPSYALSVDLGLFTPQALPGSDEDDDPDFYSYECRCSGQYVVIREQLEKGVEVVETQQKRQAKQALFDAAKPLRRAREKAQKKEKIAEKRKLIELGVLERPVSKRQNGNRPRRPYGARIVVDMGFDEKMTDKEIKSMGSQLGFCYAANRSSPTPVPFLVTSLNGRLKHRMDTVTHKAHESWREVEWWEEGYEELWADEVAGGEGEGTMVEGGEEKEVALVDLGTLKGKPRARSRREDVVYLTGDSPNVLTSLEEGKTYILGGIVDRNRYKLLCYDKANSSGIQHAQLPISEFLPEMTTRKILTVNQVFEIMLQWVEKRDWKEALQTVMPTRKYRHFNVYTDLVSWV